jgi:hypothetical protein
MLACWQENTIHDILPNAAHTIDMNIMLLDKKVDDSYK